jgi:hypothetical protein
VQEVIGQYYPKLFVVFAFSLNHVCWEQGDIVICYPVEHGVGSAHFIWVPKEQNPSEYDKNRTADQYKQYTVN